MPEESKSVFLSYASEDSEAAQRIADALKAAGIEVWFDKSELRGGEAWDRQIRKQIHDCALFIPIISAHSDARREGYFRREWKLAVDRTADMAEDVPFLLPVVIDSTPDGTARVPDRFRDVQWSRLPGGEISSAFIDRAQRLLAPAQDQASTVHRTPSVSDAIPKTRLPASRPAWTKPLAWVLVAFVVLLALAYVVGIRKHPASSQVGPGSVAASAFSPPLHSIAVLPFVNMSGDKEQEYFSDGLTEELLNDLARINELQVAARTSAFSFKGKDSDIGTVARKLNVGAVLEGSVRRSGHTVRITAQLISAVTGFHLWSETYDRDLGDVLKLQTEIATAVASALKVTLLGDIATKVELGGTHNPGAFDAYLRGTKAYVHHQVGDAVVAYTEAIRLDPSYALAFASRSLALTEYAGNFVSGTAVRENFSKALADARQAITLAPELAEGYVALGFALETASLDFASAGQAYERARALAPGNAEGLRLRGLFAVFMGRFDVGVADLRRAVTLDPLNPRGHTLLGQGLYNSRRYQEAVVAFNEAVALGPDYDDAYGERGFAYLGLGDITNARAACEIKPEYWYSQWCLAVVYAKLGHHAEAEAVFAKWEAADGDASAYQYATMYAQWGNAPAALKWLDTAVRLRDPGLEFLKVDPRLDPLRQEPRFEKVLRELKFPD